MEWKEILGILSIGALAGGVAGGLTGRSCLDELVHEQIESYRRQHLREDTDSREIVPVPVVLRRDINIRVDDAQRRIADVPWRTQIPPSDKESFIPQDSNDEYLAGKVGFRYEANQTEKTKDRKTVGTEYLFTVGRLVNTVYQSLVIKQYDGTESTSATQTGIVVTGGKITEIDIHDFRHNTTITIERNFLDERLHYNSSETDEEGARRLYDLHVGLFARFKENHQIDARIEAYTPVVNVQHTLD